MEYIVHEGVDRFIEETVRITKQYDLCHAELDILLEEVHATHDGVLIEFENRSSTTCSDGYILSLREKHFVS